MAEGRTGWLCERADAAALREGLRAVVAAGRQECRARGEAAREFSREHFGWDAIARRTMALYGEVTSGVRPDPDPDPDRDANAGALRGAASGSGPRAGG